MHLLTLLAGCFLFPVAAIAQQESPQEAKVFFTKMMPQINKRHTQWIKRTAKEANEKKLGADDVMNKAKGYAVLNRLGGLDIEALAFLVLMEAEKAAQEDLKAIMDTVKSINEKKQQLRNAMIRLNDSKPVTKLQLDSIRLLTKEISLTKVNVRDKKPQRVDVKKTSPITAKEPAKSTNTATKEELDMAKEEVKSKLDSMSEMGEMESLRLQMAMDRMSKMMSTLSNILKKISDNTNSIMQNLK